MLVTHLLCAIGTITTAYALPQNVRSDYAVKERHNVPKAWTKVGEASKSDMVHLQIGLKQQNEGVVEEHLLQVSDPSHSRYGQHLTADEIKKIITPSDETQDLVKAWLDEHGISNGVHSPSKDFIHVVLPIGKVEHLLDTAYSTYQHEDGETISRAAEWSLPKHLHEHIDVIQPTTSFFRAKPQIIGGPDLKGDTHPMSWWKKYSKQHFGRETGGQSSTGSGGAGPISQVCNVNYTTPDCIRTLYGTYDYVPQVPDKSKVAHTNYLNESSNRNDIHLTLENFRPEAAQAAYEFENVIIANAQDNQVYTPAIVAAGTNIEANLDSINILSVSWPLNFTVFSTGGSPPFMPDLVAPTNTNEPYLTWLDYVLGEQDLPQVISTSYGDDEQTVPESYAKRVCAGFATLGARGISVLFSSGDSGVGPGGKCFSNDGKNTTQFLPAFPAGCPWVTAVGGTKDFQPEVAVSRFASGAGFSNYFSAPSYQQSTVNAYIKSLNGLHDGLYNKAGRGYPDVAAQSNRDTIVYNGNITTIGGTSASSPTFAAIVALVNDALLAEGKPVLGFLNPWIYGGGYKALTDVVSGSSYGCNTTGFPAQAGWDAVTGFGTPNFPKLVEAAFEKYGGHGGYGGPKGYGGGGD
ncbi:Tripeptidyl-peptidase SED2 [Fulvia fulva]|uniref:tripeptidyl-peptidase II n=1 Tax=Passalora fulva TaxID=5499 RepID=A0A9Q8LAQ7_PASFU|nr:Tripeptidyl-peptidase SED2 [Fulvia fulva]UJO13809.1 Tripeptidyl-peptidase SED2 [Fulvia fulva]